jgi:hypothetical protein
MVSMDGLMAWVLANGYTDEVGSGISGLNPTPTGFELITTSGTTLPFTIPNLHTHSNLNNILEKLSLDVNNKLLFDGQPIGNGGDFSNYALKNGDVNNDFSANNVTVKGNIMPSANGTQSIGSPTNRFKEIYVNEAKLSVNTLYLGDTPVMGTNQDTIVIKGDKDQSIAVKTTGIGTTNLISEGNVTLSTSGMNANVNVQATGQGANANLSATNQVNLNAPNINIQGTSTEVKGAMAVDNLTIRGNVTINGGATTIQSTTVQVEDNIIELNKGEVGYGVTAGRSGLKIDRGDADDYLIIFDETDDSLKIGTDSVLKRVATENYVDIQDAKKADKVHNHDISDITGILPSTQLPIATSSNIGGVKAGTNITISADGTISSTANGSNNINDNLTTSTSNTYSIDKIVSLLNNKQNKIIVSATKPTDLTINNFWLDISSNTSYKLLRSNGTDYIQIGSSSGTDNQFEVVSTLPTSNINLNKMYLLKADFSINVYDGSSWNKYGGTGIGGSTVTSSTTNGNILINGVETKVYIPDENALKINNITVDDSTRYNGGVIGYNQSTNKYEHLKMTVSGLVGNTENIVKASGSTISIPSGGEATFTHPSATDDKLIINIQENVAGNNILDTHVNFNDSSRYYLQNNLLLAENNKLQLDVFTKLLMHMDDSNFKDECGNNLVNNGVVFNNTNYKFGNGSMYFNGTPTGNISINGDFNFGVLDFTIDFWIFAPLQSSNAGILTSSIYASQWNYYPYAYNIIFNNSNTISMYYHDSINGSSNLIDLITLTPNSWQHIAIVRNKTKLYGFSNGILMKSYTISESQQFMCDNNTIALGRHDARTSFPFNGYIDELRISNVARWITDFTPLSSQYLLGYHTSNIPLYLKTTNNSNFNLLSIEIIKTLNIPVNIPNNTTIKILFSVDNGTNWLYKDGTGIHKFTGDINQDWINYNSNTDLQIYFTNLSITQLISDLNNLQITPISLDLAFQLNTTDITVTPSVSAITLNYTTPSHREFASFGGYDESNVKFNVKRISSSALVVKNNTSTTREAIVDVIVGN